MDIRILEVDFETERYDSELETASTYKQILSNVTFLVFYDGTPVEMSINFSNFRLEMDFTEEEIEQRVRNVMRGAV